MTEMPKAVAESAIVVAARPKRMTAAWLGALLPLIAVLLAMVTLRCWVAGHVDFETDETYYWLWSRRLAASYYDHPPMVAYLIRLGTLLFGDTMLGVRCMAVLAMIAASALLYCLALVLFDDRRVGIVSVLWFNMTPHTAFFSVIMFPDTPAILFWVLTCVALALVWRSGRGEWWYLAGAALGLLLLSKYIGIFLLFGIVAWLFASHEMRFWLKRREPYMAVLIAAVLFSPVIWWNAEHGWVSFIKQLGRAFEYSPQGGIGNAAAFLGIQAAFVSPLIFAFIIAGLAVAAWRGLLQQQTNWLLLALSAAPVLLYFTIHALSAEVLAQWPSAAYATGILAAVAVFAAPAPNLKQPLLRGGFAAAPWIGLVFTSVLCAQMTLRPVAIPAAQDPLSRFAGWAQLASETGALMTARQASYIATNEHSMVGTLAFYLRNAAIVQTSDAIRYEFRAPIDQNLLRRSTGIYLAVPPSDDLARLQEHFDSVELISMIWRTRNGDAIEPYRIYELKGYRGGLPF
jgi:4-amino-4-deoxy-L-arabinose transferase-like glycosyltransferase